MEEELSTTYNTVRHRVERALKLMGYPFHVEVCHDDFCRFRLSFQGEDFFVEVFDGDYIRIQLIDGVYAYVDDVEEFSLLRRAVNEANWISTVTIVYTVLDDNVVIINYQTFVLAISQIPCFDKYLEYEISQFYFAQKKLWLEMKKLRMAEDRIRNAKSIPVDDDYRNKTKEYMKMKDENYKLFLDTIIDMGCPCDEDEKLGVIPFMYKNDEFVAKVFADTCEVTVFCNNWKSVDLNDIDEIIKLKQAVNTANAKGLCTTYYKNEEGIFKLLVSSYNSFYFSSHIDDKINYLRSKFDEFIDAQQVIQLEMESQIAIITD